MGNKQYDLHQQRLRLYAASTAQPLHTSLHSAFRCYPPAFQQLINPGQWWCRQQTINTFFFNPGLLSAAPTEL